MIDNRQKDHRITDTSLHWSVIQEILLDVSTVQFPRLRVVALKFQPETFSRRFWNMYKASVEESCAHLRRAGVSVEVK